MTNKLIATLFLLLALASAQPGAYHAQDVNAFLEDADFKAALDFGLNSLYPSGTFKVDRVSALETQVVAGLNYKISLVVLNTKTNILEDVELIVNHQSWSGDRKLLKAERAPKVDVANTKVGMWQQFPFNEDGEHHKFYGRAMMETMQFLRDEYGGLWNVKNVLGVEQQVIAGLHFKIKFQAINNDGLDKKFEVIVFAQPWKPLYQVVSLVEID